MKNFFEYVGGENEDENFEETLAALMTSVREAHILDNGDGTTTMTYIFKGQEEGETLEVPVVFPFSLAQWFGEMVNGGMLLSEKMTEWGDEGVAIPPSPEDL